MIYITGDTHGVFKHVEKFCRRVGTSYEDVLIILGDAGVNYSGGIKDRIKKELLLSLPMVFFCIHGNHEQRPNMIPTYRERMWNGGIVYVEDEYPNILFPKDGEIFQLGDKKTIVIGGAYSVDKAMRMAYGFKWWEDEQPSAEVKEYVEKQLNDRIWEMDVVLSHTAPRKYEPEEMFMQGIDQKKVDKSTENWLDTIENRLNYKKWYCGHYHIHKKIDKVEIMYENIDEFYHS